MAELVEQPLASTYLMGLTLLEEGAKVAYTQGFNRCTMHYIRFKPGLSYTLAARFLGDKPDYSKLHFCIRVYSTDTIGIVRDTVKEDAEKAVRNSWEERQAGRAANAREARKRFFLMEKQQKGEALLPEELEMLDRKKKKPE